MGLVMGQRLGLMCCRVLLNRVLSLSSVSEAKLKKVGEVRISTPDIRKQDVAEMRKRTER